MLVVRYLTDLTIYAKPLTKHLLGVRHRAMYCRGLKKTEKETYNLFYVFKRLFKM